MSEIQLTKRVKRVLMSSFKNHTTEKFNNYPHNGDLLNCFMYPVWDDGVNEWLAERLGLFTDGCVHSVDCFVLWFDWSIQVWRVGT